MTCPVAGFLPEEHFMCTVLLLKAFLRPHKTFWCSEAAMFVGGYEEWQ